MSAQFLIGIFVPTESLADPLRQLLAQKSFVVSWSRTTAGFTSWVISNRHLIDCLIVQSSEEAFRVLRELKQRDILLPALTVDYPTGTEPGLLEPKRGEPDSVEAGNEPEDAKAVSQLVFSYHEAVAALNIDDLNGVDEAIRQAVNRYLQLPTKAKTPEMKQLESAAERRDKRLFLLSLQQQRLTEKLRERLGYAGVYYKRNQRNFLRHMSASERDEFLDKLRQDYQHIILSYFASNSAVNQKIDDFVNVAFFADMSVPKIVEIHMELIDDFSKQLQLEGRNEEILADYRLTLIDVIAHLCEMYRRSTPRDM